MFLVVGLGNPGLKFRKTRHNIGFRILDAFQKENNFPKFKLNKKFHAEISEGMIDSQKMILAKPQTFMNNSGTSVRSLTTHYSLPTTQLITVHDDFDLPLGEIKVSQNTTSAGHHGVQSIIDNLKTQNFTRIRVGIRSDNGALGSANLKAEDFVLKKFTKDEEKQILEIVKKVSQILENIIKNH